jgi:hypothetical protein
MMSGRKVPLPQLTNPQAAGAVLEAILAAGLKEGNRLPTPGGIVNLVYEASTAQRYRKGKRNAFQPSPAHWLYRHAFQRRHADALALHDLFARFDPVDQATIDGILGSQIVSNAVECGLLESRAGMLTARLGIHVFDHLSLLHHAPSLRSHEGYVYIGRATMYMLDAVKEAIQHLTNGGPIDRGLDIGTGGGFGAMAIAGQVRSAVGIDIDGDLVNFASANATASGISNIEFGISDICAEVSGKFDIIMSNPPQSISDPARHTSGTHDRGGYLGQEVLRRVLEESWDHLSERGRMVICFSSPMANGRCTIYDTVDELFGDRGARVEIRELLYEYYPEHRNFYRELGIEKILRGILMIERAQSFSVISTKPAPEMLRASQVHTTVAKRLGRLFY